LAATIADLDLPAAALEHGDPELIARDLRALAALGGCLSELRDEAPGGRSLGGGWVRQALQTVRCPPARREALVDVLDVLDARAIRYRHVFLLGLSEGQFPPRLAEGSLLGEEDRLRWQRQGIELDSRRDLMAREMLLFYLAVSRADETLTLSYLQADASGHVGSPSPFLLSLLAPWGGLEADWLIQRIPPGPYLPPPAELASRRDAFNAALAGQFAPLAGDYTPLLGWAAHEADGTKLLRSAMGMFARHRRWRQGPCDEFDGRLTDPALLDALAQRYPAQTVFSAERLNKYGQCPWQYFAEYVLHLAPLVEPQRRLEPQNRGTFCHNVLCRLMESLKAAIGGGPVRLADVPEADLRAALAAAAEEVAGKTERFSLPYPALWRVQREQMQQALSDYLQAARQADDLHPEGLHFELAFGQDLRDEGPRDPASRGEPIVLATPAGELRLRGRIDRVDRIAFGEVDGLMVVDYKTGRLPTDADLAAGRNLQMPLYAAAAAAILGQPCVGGVFHHIGQTTGRFERFFAAVTAAKGREPYKVDDKYDEKLEAAMETIGRFVRQMAGGQFDAVPTHDCPSYCPFRTVCQFSPSRAERKAPPDASDSPCGAGGTPASPDAGKIPAPQTRGRKTRRKEGD
jgi:RecB family exonuclease